MNAQEIRDKFLNYFASKKHQIVPSSSLVPYNDTTLLFTNAGMNQFKNFFTGIEKSPYKRAVSIQKCVRAGGKHNDLENVGRTARHHTFFEMLGNFSFGDYFKKEAIQYAWEFLTEVLSIPKERLYVTVHYSDDEAYQLWPAVTGIARERVFRKGDKDNFWAMGDLGPCGPCSEIFYDHGPALATPNFKPAKGQDLLDDEQRFVEIWNLVFMQFEQISKDERKPLPKPSIDTGAGLERIAAALQNVYWNYDSDLFTALIEKIEHLTKTKYKDPNHSTSIRIVADHVRSCAMLIADGVLPSNEGRGYVLRRIIRRATRHLRNLDAPKNSLALLSQILLEQMKKNYPESYANQQLVFEMLASEETKFLETLDNGLKYLENAMTKEVISQSLLSGKAAFQLYDTFGFPLDLTQSILEEKNIRVDLDEFELEMKKRREDSRNSWKGQFNLNEKIFYDLRAKFGATNFLGYQQTVASGKFLDCVELTPERFGLIFDSTPFYGESGGQVGDSGIAECEQNRIEIIDTIKPIDGLFLHITSTKPSFSPNSICSLQIDQQRRKLTAANHTATHLLHKVLAEVLGDHVKQAGSFVSPEKLRFDYTHIKSPTKKELDVIETKVNQLIQAQLSVATTVKPYKEALKDGAMALFGEKYGDQVRVVKIDNQSIELCGGTHLQNTADAIYFKIISEGALSSGIRRIEALSSSHALEFLNQRSNYLADIEGLLKDKAQNLHKKIEKMGTELKQKNKEIQTLQSQLNAKSSEDLFTSPQKLTNSYCFKHVEVSNDSNLRDLSDLFLDKFPSGFVLITTVAQPQSAILLRGPRTLKKVNLNQVIKAIAPLGNIKAGGRPDMIQGKANNKDINQIANAIIAKLQDSLGE